MEINMSKMSELAIDKMNKEREQMKKLHNEERNKAITHLVEHYKFCIPNAIQILDGIC